MKLALRIWRQLFEGLAKNPVIFLPFLIVGLFDAISLILIFLAPQPPFSVVLAAPIRAFWGEKFLHYPLNFLLIPRLFGYAHLICTMIIGVPMTGMAIGMLVEAKSGNTPRLLFNLIPALKRYFTLIAIWLIVFILAKLVYRIPNLLPLNNLILRIVFYLNFLVITLIQVIFIYAIPAALIGKIGLIPAIKRGISFSKNYFLSTLILVLTPAVFYIPVMILKGKIPVLMSRFFPEIALVILGLGIVVSVLIDFVITCSTTILFINQSKAT